MAAHTYTKEAHQRAAKKFEKEKTKQFPIRLNVNTDADVITFLESLENKRGYILNLIRADMDRRAKGAGE